MPPSFIPATDVDFSTWSANFKTYLVANYAALGLLVGDSTSYTTLDTAYQAAFTAATNPATRTSATVATKVTARANAVFSARQLAAKVQANPAVTNTQRTALGITVRDATHTPVPPPATSPIVAIAAFQPLRHVCRFSDEATPLSRSKPVGSTGLAVYVKVDGAAPTSIAECRFVGIATKVPFNINYDAGEGGKVSHILAQWVNRKGQAGPVSALTTGTIAA